MATMYSGFIKPKSMHPLAGYYAHTTPAGRRIAVSDRTYGLLKVRRRSQVAA